MDGQNWPVRTVVLKVAHTTKWNTLWAARIGSKTTSLVDAWYNVVDQSRDLFVDFLVSVRAYCIVVGVGLVLQQT